MVAAVVVLWIAYLVPHRLRYRQQLLDARADDRFSADLRVVRVAAVAGPEAPVHPTGVVPVRLHPGAPHRPRTTLAPPARPGPGGRPMERPHATRDRVAADLVRRSAAEHARRAADLAARAAGARRRRVLVATLLVATLAGWGAVVAGVPLVMGLVPSALLVTVGVLGRRAVLAAARADAAWAAGAAHRLPLTPTVVRTAVGRAVHPSDAVTEVLARVPRTSPESRAAELGAASELLAGLAGAPVDGAPEPRAERSAPPAESGPAWQPVPVPRPTYTLKPSVRRPEPAPLPEVEEVPAAAARTDVPTPAATGVAGLDLDAVLARRRAVGE